MNIRLNFQDYNRASIEKHTSSVSSAKWNQKAGSVSSINLFLVKGSRQREARPEHISGGLPWEMKISKIIHSEYWKSYCLILL